MSSRIAAGSRFLPPLFAGGVQVAYYIVTGVWPLVHLESFEWVTGEKDEDWLVRTFGVLILAIGLSLAYLLYRVRDVGSARVLGVSVAVALAVSETVAWGTGAVRGVYLADAGLHVVLVVAWLLPGRIGRNGGGDRAGRGIAPARRADHRATWRRRFQGSRRSQAAKGSSTSGSPHS